MTGCDFLKEMTADFRTGGIEGFSRTFDLKSELWRVFSKGLNQLMSLCSRALRRYAGMGV